MELQLRRRWAVGMQLKLYRLSPMQLQLRWAADLRLRWTLGMQLQLQRLRFP